ncbi:RNA polymerase sigma factor [Catalinimonas niigatensis]|uniref:RNA polymerase sigma factor n=1 Tax=Catalinimonas niigatensis TaxID=1397264 RepID=UPI0026671E67|nr:sigma-70 family RNA polymerase sigma factor [Catalinimonas niigatensis]WPP51810.1 sigma-70 family RNA polymerase sigma factor [Catalinimonas niigatensis]
MSQPLRYSNRQDNEQYFYLHNQSLSCSSEAELWDEFRMGRKEAFDQIYEQFFDTLCTYGDKFCRDKNVVEDVVQELFIYLWSKKENLGSTKTIKYYLFLCLRRRLVRVLKQEQKRSITFTALAGDANRFHLTLKDNMVSPEHEEMLAKLSYAIQKLTDRQREAVYLKFYNNLSFQEVSSIMELEVKSLYNLISRTLDILRSDLQEEEISGTLVDSLIIPFLMHCL